MINLPLDVPKRRIFQCALDILVIREEKELLVHILNAAQSYLKNNFITVTRRVAEIYKIDANQLTVGLNRFLSVYGAHFIEQSASGEYRLFALARSLLNLGSLTDPHIILEGIQDHLELMELIEVNMDLIQNNWHQLLQDMVAEVVKYPGLRQALT